MPTNFASYYDAVINWKKRLAREMPLLEELARQAGGKGSGSGVRHGRTRGGARATGLQRVGL